MTPTQRRTPGVLSGIALALNVASCAPETPVAPNVETRPTLASVAMSPAEPFVVVGDSLRLGLTAFDSNGAIVRGVTVAWETLAPSTATVSAAGDAQGRAPGRAVIRAVVTPGPGLSGPPLQRAVLLTVESTDATPGSGLDDVAELPRQYVDTSEPEPLRDVHVPSGASLQAAINDARPGDRLLLERGATYSSISLPKKVGSGWVVIQTDVQLPAGRMTAAAAEALELAVIEGGAANLPVLRIDGDVSHYRFQGVEVRAAPNVTDLGELVRIDTNGSLTGALEQPSHIILDRVYIHGDPPRLQLKRCVGLSGQHVAVVNSSLLGCSKLGQDSQAIWVGDGLGPTAVLNNHLQGGSEVFMSGGRDPHVSGVVPSDIEIRRNYFHRPIEWKSGLIGVVKNLFEIKNARRVLLEANVMEGNWSHGQSGWSIVIKSTNQYGSCVWCAADDITIRWNLLDDVENGLQIVWGNSTGAPHGGSDRILIENNVIARLGPNGHHDGWGSPLRLTQMPNTVVARKNTFHNARGQHFFMYDGVGGTGRDTRISANIGWLGTYGVWWGNGAELSSDAVQDNVLIGGHGDACAQNACQAIAELRPIQLAGRSYDLPFAEGRGAALDSLAAKIDGVR